ncbi:hypothetical protein EMIHUDRAFT_231804 [Emiliania huxleyi CCMP1516]|uniref:Protein SYM1 n=2 Tax=Emiliania huxleyi TaxID=2903 RepID=A0A0D3K768_EMIH1|nr:hypothetical protein EMIHUDRAFT_231804 [Emiliania huxleyi CCMP1516]EOD31603.1 hypothetical protein EMIHUDRAFT_231804 [Emiliania huxleyi CCMP1516]|eukprot:XP_005784032.1 hypothetical protein EMIHUDRAFT_231804 [Emiliania huxleyi CCMP1516]
MHALSSRAVLHSGHGQVKRLLAVTSFSSFYTGIIATLCYETIYPRLAAIAVPTQSAMVRGIFSSGVDNFLHVPFLYMPVFYFWTCIARGGSLEGAKRDLERNWRESVVSCWAIWIPAQTANFTVVPVRWRVRAMNAGNLAWIGWLDAIAQRGHGEV